MKISWSEQLIRHPELMDMANWPAIAADSIPKKKRKAYLTNREIVARVLQGNLLIQVAKEMGVSPSYVSQLMTRALGGADEETDPALMQALVPYAQLKPRGLRRDLPKVGQRQRAGSCSFRGMIDEVAGLSEALDKYILARLKDQPTAQVMSPKHFHSAMLAFLASVNWPTDCYPYTTETLGYHSARRYLYERTEFLQRSRERIRRSVDSVNHANQPRRALRAVQIDAHKLDVQQTMLLELNDELIPLRLSRLWVLVMIDVDTRAILAYHLAFSEEPNHQDVLTLFDRALKPWQPYELTTPGLSYTPGAIFTGGEINGIPITFGTVQLDNAMSHRAYAIRDLVCKKLGATLSFGFPAMPTVRGLVESVFDFLNVNLSHRFASTTGSHVLDPKRESRKNSKRTPFLTVQMLQEALDVILSHYNTLPQASLGNASPLELMRYHTDSQYLRYVPSVIRESWQPMVGSEEVKVKRRKDGNKRAYVNFLSVRYNGAGLAKLSAGKRIRLIYDRRDLRQLHAVTLDGVDLGVLVAPKSWQRFPHSMATRQMLYKLNREARFWRQDPLADFMRWLIEQRGTPTRATQLLKICSEASGSDCAVSFQPDVTSEMESDTGTEPELLPVIHKTQRDYRWTINDAFRGEK